MPRLRRLIAWSLLLGVLVGVGAGVFHFVRYRPRCVITGPLMPVQLSADGTRLATFRKTELSPSGPLQVWDTHRGEVVHELFGDSEIREWRVSPTGRHLAVRLDDDVPRLVTWESGREWLLQELKDNDGYFEFSPRGKWLCVIAMARQESCLLDVDGQQIRLRLPEHLFFGSEDRWVFSAKGGLSNQIGVWDPASGKKQTTILSEMDKVLTSPDGEMAITWPLIERPDRAAFAQQKARIPESGLEFWNLRAGRKLFRLDFSVSGVRRVAFAPDSRAVATWLESDWQSAPLEMVDATNGRQLWQSLVNMGRGGDFSPDGTLFCFTHGVEGNRVVSVFDAATGRELWQRRPVWGPARFAGDGGTVVYLEDRNGPMLFLDAHTGVQKPAAPGVFGGPVFGAVNAGPAFTSDGRHCVVPGRQTRSRELYFWERWLQERWPQLVGDNSQCCLVMESATGREVFRVLNRDDSAALSDDAGTLLTFGPWQDGEQLMIRIWDVEPHRAWLRALSVSAATGVILLLLRHWRLKRKLDRSASKPM